MKTSKSFLFALLFLSGAFFFQSCEKEVEINEEILETVEEEALATAIFDDVFAEIEKGEASAFPTKSGEMEANTSCPSVTIDPISPDFPKTITIDFGESCEGPNGNIRSGKIIFIITGRHYEEGSVKSVTFESFFINGFQVEGTKTITNMGRKENQNMYWKIEVENAQITSPEGITFQWESVRERERTAGEATPLYFWDDEYEISGYTSGINRFQKEFTVTIQNPLVVKMACRFIVQGSVLIQVEGRPEAILDYGDGDCDSEATITVNGETKRIRLGRK
jgi:hypothetical protein